MTNYDKYVEAFCDGLEISKETVNEELQYGKSAEWDSVGHMNLIGCIEEKFDIMLDQDDMMELLSFNDGKKVLKKYGIEI